jgi:NAD(P)H-dependent flavin oxidoreductase YrpB (nitropropane dioxygenase family)
LKERLLKLMTLLPDLVIGDLKINPPIIQGGMGIRVSLGKLAGAVARAGGVGTLSFAMIGGIQNHKSSILRHEDNVRELAHQMEYVDDNHSGAIAANIMVALTDYEDLVKIACSEPKIDIIVSGAGLPRTLPALAEGSGKKLVPIVSSARGAELLCKLWTKKYNYLPDALLVEGPLAGGHLGFSFDELDNHTYDPLEKIVGDIIRDVVPAYEQQYGKKIPVIAAGGIYDGKDIAKFIKMGAAGVQLGTRFVCTDECDVSDAFKQAYLDSKEEDVIIIKSPVGMPGRALNNDFLERANARQVKFTCNNICLRTCKPRESLYCISDALLQAASGNMDRGFVFVGANAYRSSKITSVQELMNELTSEAEKELGLS